MEYIQIKNLEKYHPGYKDRTLIWCKTYFTMINADPEFEMLCEIDKWRFIALVMLQLQTKKPIPLDMGYLERKGFDTKKRSMLLTMEMLHNFIDPVTNSLRRVEKSRVEESRADVTNILTPYTTFESLCFNSWNTFCTKYPSLSTVKEISQKRREKLKKRFEVKSFHAFDAILVAIEKQPFLMGDNDRKWKVNFDWIIENDTNYLKIIEIKYGTEGQKIKSQAALELEEMANAQPK